MIMMIPQTFKLHMLEKKMANLSQQCPTALATNQPGAQLPAHWGQNTPRVSPPQKCLKGSKKLKIDFEHFLAWSILQI